MMGVHSFIIYFNLFFEIFLISGFHLNINSAFVKHDPS